MKSGEVITIKIERTSDGLFIATDDFSVVYGDGETMIEAIENYFVSLIEYKSIIGKNDR